MTVGGFTLFLEQNKSIFRMKQYFVAIHAKCCVVSNLRFIFMYLIQLRYQQYSESAYLVDDCRKIRISDINIVHLE